MRFTLGLLGVVFVVLKLLGVIAWSWWWVLSPFLVNLGVWTFAFLVVLGVASARFLR